MSEPTPAVWPTAHQAILAGQSPAIPGADPAASTAQVDEYVCPDPLCGLVGVCPPGWIHTSAADYLLSQLGAGDREQRLARNESAASSADAGGDPS